MHKIAIFSDIHGNLEALKSVLYEIDKNKYDEIICLGDVVGIGPNSKECLDLIRSREDIKMLLGNHELYQTRGTYIKELSEDNRLHAEKISSTLKKEDIDYLNSLSFTYDKLFNGKLYTFAHFLIDDIDSDYPFLLFDNYDELKEKVEKYPTNYLIVGHLHKKMYLSKDNLNLFVLDSSGCTISNITSFIELIIDKEVVVNTKYVTYDRKAYDKKKKVMDFPYVME